MKKHFRSLEFQKEIIALLLSAALLVTTYSVLGESITKVLLFGMASIIVLIPIFFFLSFVRRTGFVGGVICVVVYIIFLYGFVMINVAGYVESGVGLIEWLVTRGDDVTSARMYVLALLFGGSMFYGTVVYYFVVTRYRIAILTLTSLVPCVVYAKAIADVNNWYLIIIATLNILVAVIEARSKNFMKAEKREKKKFFAKPEINEQYTRKMNMGGLVLALCFSAIIMLIGAVIPKNKDAKYYDVFEDAFLGGDTTSDVSSIASDLMDISGNADGYRNIGNRRLYSIYGDKVTYLKRQHFDVYNFEEDYWKAIPEIAAIKYDEFEWDGSNEGKSLAALKNAIERAFTLCPELAEKYNIDLFSRASAAKRANSATINSLNFSAAYLLVPDGTYSVRCVDDAKSEIAWGGTFYRIEGKAPENYEYVVEFNDDNSTKLIWCLSGAANMSYEEALNLLNDVANVYKDHLDSSEDFDYFATLCEYINELYMAADYRRATEENTLLIPERIKKLAEEITADCIYDYEKALAISKYFSDENYVYDLSYRAPDKSAEYFIFESKRGTCSDYATAYTLMARSIGLSVRYTEGYVAESSGRNRMYYVKESGAHAYPETYIPGVGWVIFEPTSGLVEEDTGSFFGTIFGNIDMDPRLIIAIIVSACVVAAVFSIIRFWIPVFIELSIIIRIMLGRIEIRAVYKRLLSYLITRKLRSKYRKIMMPSKGKTGYTPQELLNVYSVYGKDISTIVSEIEDKAYANKQETHKGNSDNEHQKEMRAKNKTMAVEYLKAIRIFI